jgi:hypothetical protein
VRFGIAAAAFALVAPAAFGQAVESSYMPGVDFLKYHTYQWNEVHTHPNPNVDGQIKQAIESELKKRGLAKADSAPDLTIDYRVAVSQHEEWPKFRYNEITDNSPVTVYAGTLELTMDDPALKQPVWRGRVTKAVDPHASAGAKQRNLGIALQKLLKNYPPR